MQKQGQVTRTIDVRVASDGKQMAALNGASVDQAGKKSRNSCHTIKRTEYVVVTVVVVVVAAVAVDVVCCC